jgi:peptide/nickel transport system substrate-binding protein
VTLFKPRLPERSKRRRRAIWASAGVVALAAAATGATAGPAGQQRTAAGGTFVLTNLSDPDPIDPALYTHTMARTFVRNVYDPLVYYKLGTTQIVPMLATSWSVSPNGRRYTFQLRRNVKFHSGASLTSADVKATIDRDLALKSGIGGSYLTDVRNARVTGQYSIEINLKRPYAFFLGKLAKIPIHSAADIAAHRGSDYAQSWFKDNANGTGPYALTSYVRGTQYTLTQNTGYWRKFHPNAFERIIVRPIPDSTTQAQLISRGEVNMGSWMATRDMIQASKSNGAKLFAFKSPMALVGALNGGKPPLDNVKVRQAILAAFPYDRMRQFYQGYAQPVRHVLSPNYPGSARFPVQHRNLARARQLLAEAGHENGEGIRTLRYVAVQGLEDERQAGLLLQDALKRIGIEVKIDVLPFGTFFAQEQNVKTAPDIGPGYEAPETNDPFEWFNKLFGKTGYVNWSHFSVPALDGLVAKAQVTNSVAQRRAMLRQAQRLIADNAFMIPMANFDGLYAGSDWIGGFQQDITDLLAVPKFFSMYRK